jgi:hypothetical protein
MMHWSSFSTRIAVTLMRLFFSAAKAIGDGDPAGTGRIKATTRTAAEPAIIAAINRAPEKPAA